MCCWQLLSKFIMGLCTITDELKENEDVEEAHYEDHLEALVVLFEQAGSKLFEKHRDSKQKVDNAVVVNELIADMEKNVHEPEKYENINYDDYFIV